MNRYFKYKRTIVKIITTYRSNMRELSNSLEKDISTVQYLMFQSNVIIPIIGNREELFICFYFRGHLSQARVI